MRQVDIKEAKKKLSELIGIAAVGEEVIIKAFDGTAYKIVPVIQKEQKPKFGSAKGLIKMSKNFDDPIEGFEEYLQ